MVARLPLLSGAFVAALGCASELKPGTDRADVPAVVDALAVDTPAVDVPRDLPVDLPRDGGGPVDAPVDAPRPSTAQASCPAPGEVGCGMVELPGGTFTMGVVASARTFQGSPEQPRITVGPFALDAYEVTVARFRRFWADAGGAPRLTTVAYPGGAVRVADAVREPDTEVAMEPCNWTRVAGPREQHPINCVDWATAQAFCVWDGGRLPTEAEWEFAARGWSVGGLTPGRTYPWGEDDPSASCDRARWNQYACPGQDGAQTRRVGGFAPTPDLAGSRLYDLAGNVYEWSADNFVDYANTKGAPCWGALAAGRTNPVCDVDPQGAHSIRGGSWYFNTATVLAGASRYGVVPGGTLRLYGVGLRCARSR